MLKNRVWSEPFAVLHGRGFTQSKSLGIWKLKQSYGEFQIFVMPWAEKIDRKFYGGAGIAVVIEFGESNKKPMDQIAEQFDQVNRFDDHWTLYKHVTYEEIVPFLIRLDDQLSAAVAA